MSSSSSLDDLEDRHYYCALLSHKNKRSASLAIGLDSSYGVWHGKSPTAVRVQDKLHRWVWTLGCLALLLADLCLRHALWDQCKEVKIRITLAGTTSSIMANQMIPGLTVTAET